MAGPAAEINGLVALAPRSFDENGRSRNPKFLRAKSAIARVAAAGGKTMEAMQPVWQFLNSLEGFEFAAFWIASFTLTTMAGFFLDYIMQKQGFGPYFNAAYVFVGVWAGLYLRFNYLRGYLLEFRDPYLTISAIMAVIVVMLTAMAFVRNRVW
jgi:uncharacterized membrane protein YeaQ/YmgE (transglycosylase-associated protein family)